MKHIQAKTKLKKFVLIHITGNKFSEAQVAKHTRFTVYVLRFHVLQQNELKFQSYAITRLQ